ncbi:type I-E CRISPR-associated protein Cas7/Cse4/CasC [Streptomyces sp. NPDC096068]|uniref:type I-E CRISPR-associated protein Cas7/Cse4/CasC n=1 Tax=Streptomyces sp. NPDC096068 TaxID=3155424 RepID=UPI00331F13CA
MTVFINVNVLHPFPLSNLNRDDLNSPKIAAYGGVERSRVSSQSTKRTTRHQTEKPLGDKALRTRRVPAKVSAELQDRGWNKEEADKAGQAVALASGIRGLAIAEAGTTAVMLYLPEASISALADLVEKNRDTINKAAAHAEAEAAADKTGSKTKAPKLDKETAAEVKAVQADVRAILASRNASIAAFGRMLANTPEVEVDHCAVDPQHQAQEPVDMAQRRSALAPKEAWPQATRPVSLQVTARDNDHLGNLGPLARCRTRRGGRRPCRLRRPLGALLAPEERRRTRPAPDRGRPPVRKALRRRVVRTPAGEEDAASARRAVRTRGRHGGPAPALPAPL